MRRSMTYGMLVLFLLFMITANPRGTGANGRDFLDWLSGGWDDTREFVSELMAENPGGEDELGDIPIPTVEVEEPVPVEPEELDVGDGPSVVE